MDNLRIYNKVRVVPKEAQSAITGGRLKGKTDINPMWRLKVLTEMFGPAGLGWYYEIIDKRLEQGASGEVAAFVDILLFIKDGENWSKGIPGTGGSMFIANEKNGLYTSDEAFKMALTDALSVSCKALGIGADIYFEKDSTKYTQREEKPVTARPVAAMTTGPQAPPVQQTPPPAAASELVCSDCGVTITGKVADYSKDKYGRALCYKCQKGAQG